MSKEKAETTHADHDSDSEGDDGEPFRVTEEIEQEEKDERIVIREERYVNDEGKTVIRRVYKKPKSKKKRKKKKKVVKSKASTSHQGFSGIPSDEEDEGTPELMRFKLRSRSKDTDSGL